MQGTFLIDYLRRPGRIIPYRALFGRLTLVTKEQWPNNAEIFFPSTMCWSYIHERDGKNERTKAQIDMPPLSLGRLCYDYFSNKTNIGCALERVFIENVRLLLGRHRSDKREERDEHKL